LTQIPAPLTSLPPAWTLSPTKADIRDKICYKFEEETLLFA